MRMTSWLFLFVTIGGTFTCFHTLDAQTGPDPARPLVKDVPSNVQWTVTAQFKSGAIMPSDDSSMAMEIVRVDSIRSEGIGRDRVTFRNGSTQNIWYTDNAYLVDRDGEISVSPNRKSPAVLGDDLSKTQDAEYAPLSFSGFPGTSWIRAGNFKGVDKVDGIDCYHYILDARHEAWIGTATLFPAAYRNGGIIYKYSFSKDAPAKLQIPGAVEDVLQKFQNLENRRRALGR